MPIELLRKKNRIKNILIVDISSFVLINQCNKH